jgi:hypothetical protein
MRQLALQFSKSGWWGRWEEWEGSGGVSQVKKDLRDVLTECVLVGFGSSKALIRQIRTWPGYNLGKLFFLLVG